MRKETIGTDFKVMWARLLDEVQILRWRKVDGGAVRDKVSCASLEV